MNNNLIKQSNIFLYNRNISELINIVRKEYNINTNKIKFDDDTRIYKNVDDYTIEEYIFTEHTKFRGILQIIENLTEKFENSINKKKLKIIFHNFHYVKKRLNIFKFLFEKTSSRFSFIFTSDIYIDFFSSFVLCLYIECKNEKHTIHCENELNKDTLKIIETIKKPYNSIDFVKIRQMIYKLLFSYHDFTEIVNSIHLNAIKLYPNKNYEITNYASSIIQLRQCGNKDIIFIEHFILLLINNDNTS